MGLLEVFLLVVAVAAVVAGIGLMVVTLGARRELTRARAERDRARMAEAATLRVLRVSVGDLRADAMRLLGHAERLEEPGVGRAGIIALTRQVLSQIDDMQDHAVPSAASRRLEPETLSLRAMLDDAVAAVSATLGPSARHWRVSVAADDVALLADRRALRHVLTRVLGNAARHSRDGDWVEIGVQPIPDGLLLSIEDEGAGLLATPRQPPPGREESRGLGLGLVLARILMEAHGGLLTIESASRVGTRVTLRFPAHRVAVPGDATVARLAA